MAPLPLANLGSNCAAAVKRSRVMAEDSSQRVRIWRFRRAPKEFQRLFPEARDYDWIVHAAEPDYRIVGPSLLGWRSIYPVKAVTFADGSTVLWGAPREAIALLAKLDHQVTATPYPGIDRRTAVRIRIECPTRYQTYSEPKRAGEGHTIDVSSSGICFTSESLLPIGIDIIVHVLWPVRLEDGVAVELRAVGRVARAESMKAAMQVDQTGFSFSSQEQSRSI